MYFMDNTGSENEVQEFTSTISEEILKETLKGIIERTLNKRGISEQDYHDIKSRLDRTKKLRRSIPVYACIFLFCIFCAWVYLYMMFGHYSYFRDWNQETIVISQVVAIFIFALISVYFNMAMYFEEIKFESHIDQYERQFIQKDVDEDIYESSLKMSYKYLDEYYRQTREQAGKGFLITLSVAIGGAIIICVGIFMMFSEVAEPAYLTTACGVLTEFIASIFFYLYNKTVQSMGDYHNKLVLSQNVAIALKISESIDGPEKNSVKSEMIKELLKDVNQHINENKTKS